MTRRRQLAWNAAITAAVLVLAACGAGGAAEIASDGSAAAAAKPERGETMGESTNANEGERVDSGERATAYLAGGCFWGMEELLRELPGVVATEVGYTGGSTADPEYPQVHSGATGHAEAVKVVYDPSQLAYEDLLLFFFKMHDPTTLNRQGNDVGTSYRSAIFVFDDEQRRVAEEVKARVDASGAWKRPVVTEIADAGPWYRAEEYHQDYLQKHPGGYTCHFVRDLVF